ncbi:hypothetical protein GCM10009555_072660 [Acrocarpospora macrocephala]|uniref:Thymidylate kinase n=1 Tax=Acrocarpospora macrocephala TaxID=150177 RepID=A0A5M3WHH1_9ACTN|nr:dTMP kinase [Acrocarpospora macrocephala]GES08587.1 hypothetical protein Amac_021830 [Acrocarpospora macrocephala]
MTSPLFIAVEGPNGVGKSTSAALLAKRLAERGASVHLTTEPSDSPLGRLARSSESGLAGRALALAIAADRAAHLDAEILPALGTGQHVISDRYVQSSLVLQRLDGLGPAEIWRYNAFARPPDLSFYLQHDPQTIQTRLNERRIQSRLERVGTPERELELYDAAFRFLGQRGWHQFRVDCRDLDPDGVVTIMINQLDLLAT